MNRLGLSSTLLEGRFGTTPFDFAHELSDHPLTSLEALEELAATLPSEDVEHNRGSVPSVVADGRPPQANLSPAELVRTIATNDSWVVLPVHRAPAYAQLLDELFAEVQTVLPRTEGRIRHRQAVFFLASSGSTTPTHIDLEQGFLLHLRGSKELRIGEFTDTATGQRDIERFHTGGHRNIANPPQNPAVFALEPGDGVHVPAFTPHVVHAGAGQVALSLAVALRTDATLRSSAVYRANARIRRLGLSPRPPGTAAVTDELKKGVITAADRILTRRRSHAPSS
ncbi:MAG: transcriptional regulator [Actinobacteria bacterium]|nr:transcriptional regulator [Actinomycetota bacterium]